MEFIIFVTVCFGVAMAIPTKKPADKFEQLSRLLQELLGVTK